MDGHTRDNTRQENKCMLPKTRAYAPGATRNNAKTNNQRCGTTPRTHKSKEESGVPSQSHRSFPACVTGCDMMRAPRSGWRSRFGGGSPKSAKTALLGALGAGRAAWQGRLCATRDRCKHPTAQPESQLANGCRLAPPRFAASAHPPRLRLAIARLAHHLPHAFVKYANKKMSHSLMNRSARKKTSLQLLNCQHPPPRNRRHQHHPCNVLDPITLLLRLPFFHYLPSLHPFFVCFLTYVYAFASFS